MQSNYELLTVPKHVMITQITDCSIALYGSGFHNQQNYLIYVGLRPPVSWVLSRTTNPVVRSLDKTSHPCVLIIICYVRFQRVNSCTVYPKKYAHGFCFVVLCCGHILTDFPISIRLTSLALWQSNDCPSASKATLMNMDKYFMWIHYERLHNHNKAKHNKTVCIFLGIYCINTLRALLTKFKFTRTSDDILLKLTYWILVIIDCHQLYVTL